MMAALKSLLDHISICVILVLASMDCVFSFKWRVPICCMISDFCVPFFLFGHTAQHVGSLFLKQRIKTCAPCSGSRES